MDKFDFRNSVLAWRHVRKHAQAPAQAQIDLGEQKIACTNRIYPPYTANLKQDVVVKGEYYTLSRLFFTIGHYSSFFPFLF